MSFVPIPTITNARRHTELIMAHLVTADIISGG